MHILVIVVLSIVVTISLGDADVGLLRGCVSSCGMTSPM